MKKVVQRNKQQKFKKETRREFLKTLWLTGSLSFATVASNKAKAKKPAPAIHISDEPLTKEDFTLLKRMTEKVFEGNRIKLSSGTFHMPSRHLYLSMFGWDSGWHSIVSIHIDPKLSESEIELLLAQQLENGRVPHEILFKEIKIKPSFKRAITMAFGRSQYDEQGRTGMIDPPSYIVAVEKIFERTKNISWLERVLPKLEKCVSYLTKDRNLFGDGLVANIHPWETGSDSSPAYDEILDLNFKTIFGAIKRGLMYPRMLDHLADIGWDLNRVAEENKFIIEDMTFNSITIRAIVSISKLKRAIGDDEGADRYLAQAKRMVETVDRKNWDEGEGFYFSRYDLKAPKLAKRKTIASILPIFTGLISKEKADRIVKEHLLNKDEFWLPYLVPFNAKDELDEEKVVLEDLLLWRGHCIWINMNWMLVQGLLEYGYIEEAKEITRRTAKMIKNAGLWEFYDFRNGQGKGAPDYGWTGLVLDMIATCFPELT